MPCCQQEILFGMSILKVLCKIVFINKPYSTKLLEQAEQHGCVLVRGSEMLWEQGVGQFELWTGRTAPYAVMKSAVLKNCLPSEEDDDAGANEE